MSEKRNLYVEFQQHSQDYLLLLGEKTRQANKSKFIAEELATMELFWDGVDAIFRQYEQQLHILRLQAAGENLRLAVMEKEMKEVYNEFFQLSAKYRDMEAVSRVLKKSMITTKKDLATIEVKDLIFKSPEPRATNG